MLFVFQKEAQRQLVVNKNSPCSDRELLDSTPWTCSCGRVNCTDMQRLNFNEAVLSAEARRAKEEGRFNGFNDFNAAAGRFNEVNSRFNDLNGFNERLCRI